MNDKFIKLYHSVNMLMMRMGADGEVNTQMSESDAVMGALFDIDGGQYDEKLSRSGHLAEKHQGMKISAQGVLGRIADGWKMDAGLRYGTGVLLGHLQGMADRFYAGDVKAVDEFLQLYCLDEKREEKEKC